MAWRNSYWCFRACWDFLAAELCKDWLGGVYPLGPVGVWTLVLAHFILLVEISRFLLTSGLFSREPEDLW